LTACSLDEELDVKAGYACSASIRPFALEGNITGLPLVAELLLKETGDGVMVEIGAFFTHMLMLALNRFHSTFVCLGLLSMATAEGACASSYYDEDYEGLEVCHEDRR